MKYNVNVATFGSPLTMKEESHGLMAVNWLNKCVGVVVLKQGAWWRLPRSRRWLDPVNKVSDVAGSCIKNQMRPLASLPFHHKKSAHFVLDEVSVSFARINSDQINMAPKPIQAFVKQYYANGEFANMSA